MFLKVYIPLNTENFEEDSNLKRFKIFEAFEIFQTSNLNLNLNLNLKFEFESTAHLEEQCSSVKMKSALTGLLKSCVLFLEWRRFGC